MNERTPSAPPPTAAILVIGNEILSGRTQDDNLQFLAQRLFSLGIRLLEARVVLDVEEAIVEAVNALRARADYVFTTGGIGPTHDDITTAAIAKAFGLPLVEDPEARRRLEGFYGEDKLNPARLRMALIPEGATLIDNTISAAPGFHIQNVFVFAGVPSVMRAMIDVSQKLLVKGPELAARTVRCSLPESLLADELAVLAHKYPEIDIGSYPTLVPGAIKLALVLRGSAMASLEKATADVVALVKAHGQEPVVEDHY